MPAAMDRQFFLSILSYLQALCHTISSWSLCRVSSRVPDTSNVSDQALQWDEQGLEHLLVLPVMLGWF